MEFWIFFVCVCVGFVFLERIVPEKYKRFVPMCLMFFITFISAFRYRIGWDYQSYETMFYDVELDAIYPEYSFRILATCLRDIGFDFQMIFVVYAVLMSFFMWKGIKYYLPEKSLSLKILLMIISPTSLYWLSLGAIRQVLAMAIFFWCSKYVVERKIFKYIFGVILAFFFHFSAIVLLPYYCFAHKPFNKYKHIALVLTCLILSLTNTVQSVLSIALNYLGIYENYIFFGSSDRQAMDARFFLEIIIWFIVIFYRKYTLDSKKEIIINMYTLSFVFVMLFIWSSAIARIALYSAIFMSLAFLDFADNFTVNSKKIVKSVIIIGLVILFVQRISKMPDSPVAIAHPYISANNINYTFNFKLFQ